MAMTGSTAVRCSQLISARLAPCGVPFGPASNRVLAAGSRPRTGRADAGNGPLAVVASRIVPTRSVPCLVTLPGGAKVSCTPARRSG